VSASAAPLEAVADGVLDEQLTYYRARATEYDQWFNREGRYDRGQAFTDAWRRELTVVRARLDDVPLDGRDVLELAPGTGIWTAELLARGASVTAVDGAPEMIEQLRARLPDAPLEIVEADLFEWVPPRAFDTVVACFFMSHVPDERFDDFVVLLAGSVRPGGTIFLLDGLRDRTSTAAEHVLPSDTSQTMVRLLDDGREFTIVKRFRTAEALRAAFAERGLAATVHETSTYFQMVLASVPED
jgi:2-polyprenyl-3-methyl-5-hydroxy-6-metoxy-1,4-benzoquinol methylase